MNIAVFASHGGSDLQAMIDGCKNNQINAKVPVLKDDTPETLGARVLDREHTFLVEVIADIVEGKIELG